MSSMTVDFSRRFPWATVLSVVIHGSVVVGILYTSMHQVIELPSPAQPISVTMVAPVDLTPPVPQPAAVAPEPVVEPEPVEPKEAPVVIHKPKQQPKPKPVKKPEPRKPAEKNTEAATPPTENTLNTRTAPQAVPSVPAANSVSVNTAPQGPKALSRNQPQYPARAFALRIEGKVRVQFDVLPDGSVDNINVLSAQPANMFERDVKQAMRHWRYESGRPGKGLIVNIIFKINGGASME